MIDGIKIEINDQSQILKVLEKPILSFDQINKEIKSSSILSNNKENKDVYDSNVETRIAKYKGLRFTLKIRELDCEKKYKLFINGSLHKFYNEGFHNYNDFSYNNLLDTIAILERTFDLQLDKCAVTNIEIGFNIIAPSNINKIIDHIYLHNRKFPNLEISTTMHLKRFAYYEYHIKLYNKTLQYKNSHKQVPKNLLRFEIKYFKMRKSGLKHKLTLNDIKKFNLIETTNIVDKLVIEWNSLIFYDYTISGTNSKHITDLKNENFWKDCAKSTKLKTNKTRLNKLIQNHSDKIQNKIQNLLISKAQELGFYG